MLRISVSRYRDADVSYKMSTGDRFGNNAFQVRNVVDASQLAITILQIHWQALSRARSVRGVLIQFFYRYRFFGLQSSPGLTYFQQSTHRSFIKNPMREWELFTTGTLTMALAKVMNTETYQSLYQPAYVATVNPLVIRSPLPMQIRKSHGRQASRHNFLLHGAELDCRLDRSPGLQSIMARHYRQYVHSIAGRLHLECVLDRSYPAHSGVAHVFGAAARFRPVTLNPLNREHLSSRTQEARRLLISQQQRYRCCSLPRTRQ